MKAPTVRGGTIFLVLVTLLVFTILVKLGLWQLDRAAEKQALQQALTLKQAAAPLDYQSLLALAKSESLTGYRLAVKATPVDAPIILLDNQVYEGYIGYLAYQVMRVETETEIEADDPLLLVELGFIDSGLDRQKLPQLTELSQEVTLSGRVYQRASNPLSQHLLAETGSPMRIQNLNLPELSQTLGLPLAPAILQPKTIPGSALPHPWQPIPMSAQKHQGYALQWFSMATAFLILMAYLLIFKRKNKESSKDK
ncbi:SURF1 family protein [Shewanella alkalitolerans]|uniref:SURF1 family protein n=1 Tax=Shewanella alkalitolerans TaxID=2864209 RepID=UPI001C66076C|nr:SURF1 family protein [Shewanella alkalitolerans]QYJ97798.1 SURF1 family protein [Shewanella alkalitolerans]